MAKKKAAKKKAANKRVGKTPVATKAQRLEAAEIVKKISARIEDTLGALTPAKQLSSTALSEWSPKLRKAVEKNLALNQKWAIAEPAVLAVAADMARIAAILSTDDPSVPKARLHAAFRAAKAHKSCPGAGGGAWCDFDM
jgi:hypothetical protein